MKWSKSYKKITNPDKPSPIQNKVASEGFFAIVWAMTRFVSLLAILPLSFSAGCGQNDTLAPLSEEETLKVLSPYGDPVDVTTLTGRWVSVSRGASQSIIRFEGRRFHLQLLAITDPQVETYQVLTNGVIRFPEDGPAHIYYLGQEVSVTRDRGSVFFTSGPHTFEYRPYLAP